MKGPHYLQTLWWIWFIYGVIYGHRLTDLEFLDRFFKNTSCKIAMSGLAGIGRCSRFTSWLGWSGGVKVLCILHHRGVQLILAYRWARPAILVVGKGRGGMFLFLLFLHFHSCSSFFPVPLFHLLYSLFCLFSPFLWETTQNDPQRAPVA